MKRLVVVLILILVAGTAVAQKKQGQARLDSLENVLRGVQNDTARVNILCELSYDYHTVEPPKGTAYGEEALALAKRLQYKFGIANAHRRIGNNCQAVANYSGALEHYLEALKIFDAIGSLRDVGITHSNMGLVYSELGDFDNALKNYNLFEDWQSTER